MVHIRRKCKERRKRAFCCENGYGPVCFMELWDTQIKTTVDQVYLILFNIFFSCSFPFSSCSVVISIPFAFYFHNTSSQTITRFLSHSFTHSLVLSPALVFSLFYFLNKQNPHSLVSIACSTEWRNKSFIHLYLSVCTVIIHWMQTNLFCRISIICFTNGVVVLFANGQKKRIFNIYLSIRWVDG